MGCDDYAVQFDWAATFEQHKGRTRKMGYWNQEWQNLRDKGCICDCLNYDVDQRRDNAACPYHHPEHADHLVAETIGGTNRTARQRDSLPPNLLDDIDPSQIEETPVMVPIPEPYLPGRYDKHPPIPDHNGYCRQRMSDGQICDLTTENEIHRNVDHAQLKSANIAGIGRELPNVLQPDPRPNMYPPHPFQGQEGLIGSPCRICGGLPGDATHAARTTAVPKSQALKALSVPVCYVETVDDRAVNYEFLNLSTEQSKQIIRELLPDMLNRFLAKNKDYGDQFLNLGPKAEFVRMANKFGKLKQALWDDEDLEFEQVDEILDDLLGHILLARLGLSR